MMSWRKELETTYIQNLTRFDHCLLEAMSELDIDIDSAVQTFSDCFLSASKCMVIKKYQNVSRKKEKWFDSDCKRAKVEARAKLRIFRDTRSHEDRTKYVDASSSYWRLRKSKRRAYRKKETVYLTENIRSNTKFWSKVKLMGGGTPKTLSSDRIDAKDWVTSDILS